MFFTAAPVITVPPVNELEVELGGQFSIFCEAVGVPTPLIVWRLNWGNIPTGNRVRVESQGGRGTLTITDVRYTDAGAYTCEAINNRGSIFAIPDALVIVRRKCSLYYVHFSEPFCKKNCHQGSLTRSGTKQPQSEPEALIFFYIKAGQIWLYRQSNTGAIQTALMHMMIFPFIVYTCIWKMQYFS